MPTPKAPTTERNTKKISKLLVSLSSLFMVVPVDSRPLDELVRGDFQTLRDCFFSWLLVCTIIVAIGVILEIVEPFGEKIPFGKLRLRISTRYLLASWFRKIARVGGILVVVGVVGEGICEGLVSKADGWLQTFNETLLSETSSRASKAELTAFAFESQIQDSKRQAAVALQNAEQDRLARVRLEKQIQPRDFTPEEEKRIISACAPFAGRLVNVRSQPYDVEGAVFAYSLADVLRKTALRLRITDIGNNFMQNVPMTFDVHITGPENEQDLVRALAGAIATPRVRVAPLVSPTRTAIPTTILVGARILAPIAN
jgi:hypothetical protein